MNTTNNNITFQGNPLTVLGDAVKVGQSAPEIHLVGNDMKDLTWESFNGKIVVVSVVPSLDTPVCSIQTKKFNTEAAKWGAHCAVLTVSLDLPFAQKRWCGAEGVSNVVTASDYKYHSFGQAWGCLIKEMGLLARAVFVVDSARKVRHVEYVPAISEEPDYAQVGAAVNAIL
jgi:thiol peroxidase